MTIVDFVEVRVNSVRDVFESAYFQKTRDNRPKHSCALTLRRQRAEVSLVVWESGEAAGDLRREHFDDLVHPEALSTVLARVMTIIDIRDRQ